MMPGASADYPQWLAEYRQQLAWARGRLAGLPPAYEELSRAYITTCEAAVRLVEQLAAVERQQAQAFLN